MVTTLGVYLASRLVALAAIAVGTHFQPGRTLSKAFTSWDAGWWLLTATEGYPDHVPEIDGRATASTIAFFPLFPVLVRGVRLLTPLSTLQSAIAVSLVAGAVAAVLLWFLVAKLLDEDAAGRSVVLFCFFPASFALMLPLSEGVMLVAALGCLLALVHHRWLAAGLLALAAGAARPTGLVLAACCGVAALLAIRDRREWRALVAPALAPWGTIGYFAFLWGRTGEAAVWFRVEDEGWEHGASDFGYTSLLTLTRFLRDPTRDVNVAVSSLALLFTLVGVYLMWRWRPPASLWVFTAGMTTLTFFPVIIASRARYTFVNVPLLIAVARVTRNPTTLGTVVGVSATLMGALALITLSSIMATF